VLLVNISQIKTGEIVPEEPFAELSKAYKEGRVTDKQYLTQINRYYDNALKNYSRLYSEISSQVNIQVQKTGDWEFYKNILTFVNIFLILALVFFNSLLIKRGIIPRE
jgi:hypothetical protein